LQRLTGMEQQKIIEELADIQAKIAEYLDILGSEKSLRRVIVEELKEVSKDFGDERRTQIIEDTGEISLEDLVQSDQIFTTLMGEDVESRRKFIEENALDVRNLDV